MNLKLKNLILIILLAILIILGIGTMAFADGVKHTPLPNIFSDIVKGDRYELNYNDLNQSDTFCIQHNQKLDGDENREYIVKNIIKIKGSKAWEISYDKKGNVKWINEKSDVNDYNLKLAAAVYYSSITKKYDGNTHTQRQLAVWYYMHDWMKNIGKKFSGIDTGITSDNNEGLNKGVKNRVRKYVKKQKKQEANESDAYITNYTGNLKSEIYNLNGTDYIKISGYIIDYEPDLNKFDIYGTKIGSTNSEDITTSCYALQKETKLGDIRDIEPNEQFELLVPRDIARLDKIELETEKTGDTDGTITLKMAFLKCEQYSWQNLCRISVSKDSETQTSASAELPGIDLLGSLQIEKVDADNSNLKMANVGFKVQNVETGGWVKADSSLGSFEEAKTFMTGADGKTEVIPNLLIGNYKPVETVNPYSGYIDTNPNLTQYVSAGTTQNVTVVSKTNKHVYTSISGYVWVDGEVGKTASMNGTFDNGEGKNGITVRLWDHRGDILVGEMNTKTTIDSNGQTRNGKYQFDNVKVDDLKYLHIDFYYNGITYATVNPKPSAYQYNADGTKVFIDAGTKAVENSGLRENLNNKFGNITNNGLGQNSIKINDGVTNDTLGYSRDIANYKSTVSYAEIYTIVAARAGAWKGLEGDNSVWQSLCNDFSLTERFEEIKAVDPFVANGIENVNLGLKVREKPNMSVLKDIERVKLSINGYNHIYNYNTRYQKYGNNQGGFYDGKTPEEFNVGVKFGNEYGSMAYTRPIYKSDYTYENPKDKSKELQVYITYKIMIYNNTTTLQERN